MNCPHCKKEIADDIVLKESASIMGSRSKRSLSTDEARALGKAGAAKRWGKKKEKKGTKS